MTGKRFCILASPRSGSTLLEEILYSVVKQHATYDYPAYNLMEFLHISKHSYFNSKGETENFDADYDSDVRYNFRQKICEMITNSNYCFVLRIFPQEWMKDYLNLFNFLTELKNNEFTFVYLKRNFFDRLISLNVAEKTNIWHRRIQKEEIILSVNDDHLNVPKANEIEYFKYIVNSNTITIDTERLFKTFYHLKMADYYNNKFEKDFPGIIINYETFFEDIEKANIPIIENPSQQKLYGNIPYTLLINNYNEVIEQLEWFKNGR